MDEAESLRLLRAFEPVVRLTQGEYFLPTGVDGYVSNCSLWLLDPSGASRRIAEPGSLPASEGKAKRVIDERV